MSERSARKVGESVHTLPTDCAKASKWSCDETVRYLGPLKNELSSPAVGFGASEGSVSTLKTSPAPSQSEDVMIGGCVWTNSLSAKNSVRLAMDLDRNWSRRALNGRRALMCGIVRRYSADWYFFCKGKVYTTSDKDLKTKISLALRAWVGYSHTAGSEAPSSETSFTWSSHDCALLLGDAVQLPVKRTAAPVERLSLH